MPGPSFRSHLARGWCFLRFTRNMPGTKAVCYLRFCALLPIALTSPLLHGQASTGELRLHVTDSTGAGLPATVAITSEANQFRRDLQTDGAGLLDLPALHFGLYSVHVDHRGFASQSLTVALRSGIPTDAQVKLNIAPVTAAVQVREDETLIDPEKTSSIAQIGKERIARRLQSLPGRSIQDLVNSQPGWLYEGNAVLHPRGSEYQTQVVLNGIPLTDNRSPSFGPEIEADNIESISTYTAGIPAEYGRKLGGVVELNTRPDPAEGLHGQVDVSGGSYATGSSYVALQEKQRRNVFGVSASGSSTSHYLNPVVPENYTNKGTTGDFAGDASHDFTSGDRIDLAVRHEFSRFEIPNEDLQEQAGQLQNGNNGETLGTVQYRHLVSADVLTTYAGMVRDNTDSLKSNAASTPIIATQNNSFREIYAKSAVTWHRSHQEIKAGLESDNTFLHEHFAYLITDPTQFDDDTPPTLTFSAARPDLEQGAFIEDVVRLGQWTVSAGLRWDHYQLLLNQKAFSPRLSVGRSFPNLNLVLHASFDRVFQTPSSSNILISSSPQIQALSSQFLRLPVQPSRGNYYEAGASKALLSGVRLDANVYRRAVRNYADDDQLLNTGVSYPISFSRSVIYGAEGTLTVVHLARLSGYMSYSYMVGTAWNPVTGGLFLGDDAAAASTQVSGHFPDSQDQRNTLRTRFTGQVTRKLWIASGANYGSGLPFQFTGDQADALKQYGPAVVARVNFDRGRVRPQLAVSASAGYDVYKSERVKASLQIDGDNLNDRLNVIDFGGLFSGNAIAPGRSFSVALRGSF